LEKLRGSLEDTNSSVLVIPTKRLSLIVAPMPSLNYFVIQNKLWQTRLTNKKWCILYTKIKRGVEKKLENVVL
jgi:hypothetical protein